MSDNLTIRQPQDPRKINIHEEWELNYWSKKFGVSKQDIINAVRFAGVMTTNVAKHLGKKWP